MTPVRRKNKRAGAAAKGPRQTSKLEKSETSTSNDEHVERAAETGSNVASSATRAGADVARVGAEVAQESSDSDPKNAVHAFHGATDQFTEVFGLPGAEAEELARRAFQNFEVVSQASTVLAKRLEELSREWFNAMRERLEKNFAAVNRLASCHSVQDLAAVQSEIAREALGEAVNSSRRIVEVSIRIAEEAGRIIQSEGNQRAGYSRRSA